MHLTLRQLQCFSAVAKHLSYTKAAAELRERAGVTSGALVPTVHSLGWEIMREARPGVRLLEER